MDQPAWLLCLGVDNRQRALHGTSRAPNTAVCIALVGGNWNYRHRTRLAVHRRASQTEICTLLEDGVDQYRVDRRGCTYSDHDDRQQFRGHNRYSVSVPSTGDYIKSTGGGFRRPGRRSKRWKSIDSGNSTGKACPVHCYFSSGYVRGVRSRSCDVDGQLFACIRRRNWRSYNVGTLYSGSARVA